MPLVLRLAGLSLVPLVAAAFAIALHRFLTLEFGVALAPSFAHAAVLASLVFVGAVAFRWSRRASVAAGTVLAAMALAEFEQFESQAKANRNVRAAIEKVAARLGNTPTICFWDSVST